MIKNKEYLSKYVFWEWDVTCPAILNYLKEHKHVIMNAWHGVKSAVTKLFFFAENKYFDFPAVHPLFNLQLSQLYVTWQNIWCLKSCHHVQGHEHPYHPMMMDGGWWEFDSISNYKTSVGTKMWMNSHYASGLQNRGLDVGPTDETK